MALFFLRLKINFCPITSRPSISTALAWSTWPLTEVPIFPLTSSIPFPYKGKGWFSFCLEKWWFQSRGGCYYLPKTLQLNPEWIDSDSLPGFILHSSPPDSVCTRCTFFSPLCHAPGPPTSPAPCPLCSLFPGVLSVCYLTLTNPHPLLPPSQGNLPWT